MSINWKRSLVIACAVLLGGTRAASAQHVHGEVQHPFDTHAKHDFQPFAPAPLSEYGDGPQPNEGWFFTYERAHWHVGAPEFAEVGSTDQEFPRFVNFGQFAGRPLPISYENGMSNGYMDSEAAYTNRYEFGYVIDDCGWIVSVNSRLRQEQLNLLNGTVVLFDDPLGLLNGYVDLDGDGWIDDLDGDGIHGPDGIDDDLDNDGIPADLDDLVYIPPRFDTLKIRNIAETSGAEVMRLFRYDVLHYGGVFEWGIGGRYFEFDDTFYFSGGTRDNVIPLTPVTGGDLARTIFKHKVDNHIVGPQIQARWSRRSGRWTLSSEGKFTAGMNFRSLRQEGEIATQFRLDQITLDGEPIPPNFIVATDQTTFKNRIYDEHFSPLAELRLDASYQLTKGVSLKFGWTGMFADNVVRATNTIIYRVPTMAIADPGHGEDLIIQGVNVGVEWNR